MFPVYIYDSNIALPKEGNYYVIADNGIFLHKDTGIMSGFVPVESIPVMDSINVENHIRFNAVKIPAIYTQKIKQFFKDVVNKYHAESIVNLYYNKETKQWKLQVPKQSVSHGGVSYMRKLTPEEHEEFAGYLCVGTIHSHCDFGAFHSGVDIGDEKDFDGLHVTFGHNHKDQFTITASLVLNGVRVKIDPEEMLEGIEQVVDDYYTLTGGAVDVSSWMSKVKGGVW